MDKLRSAERASDNQKLKSILFRRASELVFETAKVNKPEVMTEWAHRGVTNEDGEPLRVSSRALLASEFVTKDGVPPEGLESMQIVYYPTQLRQGIRTEERVLIGVYRGDDTDLYTLQMNNPGSHEVVDVEATHMGKSGLERNDEATHRDLSRVQAIFHAIREVNF